MIANKNTFLTCCKEISGFSKFSMLKHGSQITQKSHDVNEHSHGGEESKQNNIEKPNARVQSKPVVNSLKD